MTKKQTPSSNQIYAKIIERIIADLEAGNVPVWRQPFNFMRMGMHFSNPFSGNHYNGQNIFLLGWTMLIEGWNSPFFATYNQVKEKGGNVIKGSTGIRLVKYFQVKETKKEAAERLHKSVASISEEDRQTKFLRPSYFTVFNLKAQTEGIEDQIPEFTLKIEQFEPDERCEEIWTAYKTAPEVHWTATEAGYSPMKDIIVMPPQSSFNSNQDRYATLFHEGIHSTGHQSRLDRKLTTNHSEKDYAIEELVAEIGAALLCGKAGISNTVLSNQTAYIQAWLKALKDNPDILFKASKLSEAAVEYILGESVFTIEEVEPKQELNNEPIYQYQWHDY